MTLSKIVEDTAVELLRISATELPVEYVREMDRLAKQTKGATGKSQIRSILDNVGIARKNSWPMCQDTGVVAFMVKVGDKFPLRSELNNILTKATRRATDEIPIRPNAVDMLKGNTNDNTGAHVPIIYWELAPGNELEIIAMPKGGGSSNVANHRMLKPGLGMKGVKQFVIEAVAAAGSQGCPPYFVGVGIGASVLAYTDSDALFSAGWLSDSLRILETYPKVGMVTSRPFRTPPEFYSNTLAWAESDREVQVERGSFIAWEAFREFDMSLGQEEEQVRQRYASTEDIRLTYRGVPAMVGASHWQFMGWTSVLRQFVPFQMDRPMGQVRQLDQRVNAAGLLRLMTSEPRAMNMSNSLAPVPAPGAGVGRGAAGSPARRLLNLRLVRRVLLGLYDRIFRWYYTEGQGRR